MTPAPTCVYTVASKGGDKIPGFCPPFEGGLGGSPTTTRAYPNSIGINVTIQKTDLA